VPAEDSFLGYKEDAGEKGAELIDARDAHVFPMHVNVARHDARKYSLRCKKIFADKVSAAEITASAYRRSVLTWKKRRIAFQPAHHCAKGRLVGAVVKFKIGHDSPFRLTFARTPNGVTLTRNKPNVTF